MNLLIYIDKITKIDRSFYPLNMWLRGCETLA